VISARNSARDSDSNLVAPKGSNQLGGDLVRGDSDPFEVSTRCDGSDYGGQERLEAGAVRAGQVAKLHALSSRRLPTSRTSWEPANLRIAPSSPPTRRSTVEFDDLQVARWLQLSPRPSSCWNTIGRKPTERRKPTEYQSPINLNSSREVPCVSGRIQLGGREAIYL
jgi:hypothetical protein